MQLHCSWLGPACSWAWQWPLAVLADARPRGRDLSLECCPEMPCFLFRPGPVVLLLPNSTCPLDHSYHHPKSPRNFWGWGRGVLFNTNFYQWTHNKHREESSVLFRSLIQPYLAPVLDVQQASHTYAQLHTHIKYIQNINVIHVTLYRQHSTNTHFCRIYPVLRGGPWGKPRWLRGTVLKCMGCPMP